MPTQSSETNVITLPTNRWGRLEWQQLEAFTARCSPISSIEVVSGVSDEGDPWWSLVGSVSEFMLAHIGRELRLGVAYYHVSITYAEGVVHRVFHLLHEALTWCAQCTDMRQAVRAT